MAVAQEMGGPQALAVAKMRARTVEVEDVLAADGCPRSRGVRRKAGELVCTYFNIFFIIRGRLNVLRVEGYLADA